MPGEDIAQGVAQGLTQFNPVTKMMGMASQGGDQIMQLLQQLGLLQPQQPQVPMPMPGQVGASPTMPAQGLKARMTGQGGTY